VAEESSFFRQSSVAMEKILLLRKVRALQQSFRFAAPRPPLWGQRTQASMRHFFSLFERSLFSIYRMCMHDGGRAFVLGSAMRDVHVLICRFASPLKEMTGVRTEVLDDLDREKIFVFTELVVVEGMRWRFLRLHSDVVKRVG
jgi:hypothetical protein